MAMNVVVEDERILKKYPELSMFTSADGHTEVSISLTRANVHMTPWKEDLRNTRTVNRRCTFGNKGQLQALPMGEIPLHVKVEAKEAPTKVTLKDVLWISGLPCRLLSAGTIRRDGGEIVDSVTKKSYLRLRKDGPKIPLAQKKNILTLSGSVQGNDNYAASAHASCANEKHRLTLKEWHNMGNINPPAIKHSNVKLSPTEEEAAVQNSRRGDLYRPGGTFSPGRDRNAVLSSFRGRSYPRQAHTRTEDTGCGFRRNGKLH